mgnify:CR=1 FL=1
MADTKTLDQRLRKAAVDKLESDLNDWVNNFYRTFSTYSSTETNILGEARASGNAPKLPVGHLLKAVTDAVLRDKAPYVGDKAVADFLANHERMLRDIANLEEGKQDKENY